MTGPVVVVSAVSAPHVPHDYLSTACLHGKHKKCGVAQLARGDTGPPHCKYCSAICKCIECLHEEQHARESR